MSPIPFFRLVLSFTVISFFTFTTLNAQTRMAVYSMKVNKSKSQSAFSFGHVDKNGPSPMRIVPEKIISYFSSDPDFVMIDRKNKELIKDELDLQKSENFMDGYIVEQGKSEGVDMICSSFYDEGTQLLVINIYDVSTGKVFCSRERRISKGWTGLRSIEKDVTIMLHEISSKCFDKKFPVVRLTKEKKGKAKEILILAGYAQKMKLGYVMEIFQFTDENVAGKVIKRKMKIGEGEVLRIEDDNFSTLVIIEGKKEIHEALKNGVKLECKLVNN